MGLRGGRGDRVTRRWSDYFIRYSLVFVTGQDVVPLKSGDGVEVTNMWLYWAVAHFVTGGRIFGVAERRGRRVLRFTIDSLNKFVNKCTVCGRYSIFNGTRATGVVRLIDGVFANSFRNIIFVIVTLLACVLNGIFFMVSSHFVGLRAGAIDLVTDTVTLLVVKVFPGVSGGCLTVLPVLFMAPIL